MNSTYSKYISMMNARMLMDTNLFASNTSKSKKSSLADFSFMAGKSFDNFSFLDLVNKNIAEKIKQQNNTVNSATINEIKNQLEESLEQLDFKDNTIEISDNARYKVSTLTHGLTSIITSKMGVNSLVASLFSGVDEMSLYSNKNEYTDVTNTIKLMNSLVNGNTAGEKLSALREFFPSVKEEGGNKELLARLKKLGVEPGKELKIKGCKDSLFLEEDGSLYTMNEVNKFREDYNKTNYFSSKYNYTKDTVFKIDGKEYKLDDTGHLNIPAGVVCTPYRVSIIRNLG